MHDKNKLRAKPIVQSQNKQLLNKK